MLIVFPLNDKPDWRHPPWITLLLILITAIIFFGPQRREAAAEERAATYYLHSELPRIEYPRYLAELRERGTPEASRQAQFAQQALDRRNPGLVLQMIESDRAFLARLDADEVISASDPVHYRWRDLRERFQVMRGPSFTRHWGLDPSLWRPLNLLTATFLHGGFAHWFGNMLFLFVFGYTVERTLGPLRYLMFYLLSGLGGSILDQAARYGSDSIGVGASGAIAGLMAMYVVLYGLRRIKFFFQILFYFDYVTAPAIILLPAWIIDQLLQQWFGSSGIAYMAHLGGLLTGAGLMTWFVRRHAQAREAVVDRVPVASAEDKRKDAYQLVVAMRLDEARLAYARLASDMPSDRTLVEQFFNVARLAPDSEEFHQSARLVFRYKAADAQTGQWIHDSFRTYLETARPAIRMATSDLAPLILRFAREGYALDAAILVQMLFGRTPQDPRLPLLMLTCIEALKRVGEAARAERMSVELCRQYPDSDAALAISSPPT